MRLAPLLAAASIALLASAAPAAAQTPVGEYEHCTGVGPVTVVDVSGATCADATVAAAAVAAVEPADTPVALSTAGWTPMRALPTQDEAEFDVISTRGRAALRIRRGGQSPDLDGWAGGRELLFARATLVPGGRVPSGAVLCSSAFLIRVNGRLGGLSASHCGGTSRNGTVVRRNAALRRPPQPGVVLGRVVRNLERTAPLDALVLPLPSGPNRTASSVIDRGLSRPPFFVTATAKPLSGRSVCFSGRTSGIDQCGRILGSDARAGERILSARIGTSVRCTNIRAREGDSGSSVYTAPRSDGTVRAVGIAVVVIGPGARMCFTPLLPVLGVLGATLVTAP